MTLGEILQLPRDEALIFISGAPPIRARKLQYYRDRNFLARCLPPPLRINRKARRGASHDWAGFIRTPHPALDRDWSELVTASDERHEDRPRSQHATAVFPELDRGETPARFKDGAEPASRVAEDDGTTIELPGGVRLS